MVNRQRAAARHTFQNTLSSVQRHANHKTPTSLLPRTHAEQAQAQSAKPKSGVCDPVWETTHAAGYSRNRSGPEILGDAGFCVARTHASGSPGKAA